MYSLILYISDPEVHSLDDNSCRSFAYGLPFSQCSVVLWNPDFMNFVGWWAFGLCGWPRVKREGDGGGGGEGEVVANTKRILSQFKTAETRSTLLFHFTPGAQCQCKWGAAQEVVGLDPLVNIWHISSLLPPPHSESIEFWINWVLGRPRIFLTFCK